MKIEFTKSDKEYKDMDSVYCEYWKFIGCPCCSPEYEHIESEIYELVADHDEQCEYQDNWDRDHEIHYVLIERKSY